MSAPKPPASLEEQPPVFGSWRRAYAVVLIELGVLVVLFAVLRHWASA